MSFSVTFMFASAHKLDSLKNITKQLSESFSGNISDTSLINSLILTGDYYSETNTEEAFEYYKQALNLMEIIRLKHLNPSDNTINIEIDYKLSQIYFHYALANYYNSDFVMARNQCLSSIELIQKHIDKKSNNYSFKNKLVTLKAKSYAQIGNCYLSISEYELALKFYTKALDLNINLKNKKQQASIIGNMGLIMENRGRYADALSYYFQSLKIEEEIKNEMGQAVTLGNIGIVYYNQKEYDKALEYYNKSLTLKEKNNEKSSISTTLGNIGIVYHEKNNFEKALEYYTKALEADRNNNNFYGVSRHLGNIGLVYEDKKDYISALNNYFEALEIDRKLNNITGIAYQMNYIGNIYILLNNLKKAEEYLKEAFQISYKMGSIELQSIIAEKLSKLYEKTNKTEQAYYYYKIFTHFKDSLKNEENTMASIEKEMQYLYEKKSIADSLAFEKEKALSYAEIKRQKAEIKLKRNQQYGLFIGLFIIILFSIFIYNRFRVTKKQKEIIEFQKILVERKNTEIVDSIKYAKRIQSAILPATKVVKEYLPENFILYQPKDVVSGDFYWLEHKNNTILFAAADCTGHGVPGAMVSVVCNNALNRSVREYELIEPGKILDKIQEIVVQEFEKSDDEVKDGMDIALCSLRFNVPSSKLDQPEMAAILQYAGANNPLWMIRNHELIEYKANKQPIGKVDNPKPFTTHTIDLQKGDTIYIFTDGFADQFGGEKGKKLMYKPFKELLLSMQEKTMDEQKELLEQHFNEWKGNLEQVDDVCVIGVRI